NLLDPNGDVEVRQMAAEHGIAYTAYSALASGVLTGKYRRNTAPPAGSLVDVGYLDPVSASLHDALDRLRAAAEDRASTTGALALAWLMNRPDVTAITTAPSRSSPHLSLVAEALSLELRSEEGNAWASWFIDAASESESPT
ncbi:MAG: aldo/keto reductase, partial [Acidimicrobiia bacterium]|nr:aldo/keto reductase [Acidimicrobiia bacterium]